MTDLDPAATSISPGSPYEPTVEAAPATLVPAPGPLVPRRSFRWPIAIGLVALVIAVSAVVAFLITGQAPAAKVLGYVPPDSVMYGEVRLDLPGDQRMAVASFLSKFPGFADQSAIEGKVNEVLDEFVDEVSGGQQSYTTDIQPWFDGELAFSLGSLPDPSTLSNDPSGMSGFHALFLVSVKDEAGVTAWFNDLVAANAMPTSTQAYNGANLTVLSSEGEQAAFAVLGGKVAVIGDIDSVKAAVDTKGNGAFASQPNPKAAFANTNANHVEFLYLEIAPLLEWSNQMSQASGADGALGLDLTTGPLGDLIPQWEAVALRIENDAIVLEAVSPTTTATAAQAGSDNSSVFNHVPASALFVETSRDLGPGIIKTLDLYRSEPSLKSAIDSIDQAAGVLGGTKGAIGWIGDTAVVVNGAAGGVEGGLVIVPTDRAAADRTFTTLRTFLALGGSEAGIVISDEPYASVTVTTIDLGDISTLAGLAGELPSELGPGSLPTGHVKLAYAITDEVVVFGSSAEFVKHVLDTTTASSLASTDRYKALVARAGGGTPVLFMDITAIRGLIETAAAGADPSAMATYEQEIKPFLEPFDALIASSLVKDDVTTGKFIVTVH